MSLRILKFVSQHVCLLAPPSLYYISWPFSVWSVQHSTLFFEWVTVIIQLLELHFFSLEYSVHNTSHTTDILGLKWHWIVHNCAIWYAFDLMVCQDWSGKTTHREPWPQIQSTPSGRTGLPTEHQCFFPDISVWPQ